MAHAANDNTVLVVGSAPQYPQGVIDPIEAIAAIATERGISCHVDAVHGRHHPPHVERLGYAIPPWSFRRRRDLDLGRPPQVRLHRKGRIGARAPDARLRAHPDVLHRRLARRCVWLLCRPRHEVGRSVGGGLGGDAAPRPGRLPASHRQARGATERLIGAIRSIPGLVVRGEPAATLVAFGSEDDALDVFAIG